MAAGARPYWPRADVRLPVGPHGERLGCAAAWPGDRRHAAAIGLTVLLAGPGLMWATKGEKVLKPDATEPEAKRELEPVG